MCEECETHEPADDRVRLEFDGFALHWDRGPRTGWSLFRGVRPVLEYATWVEASGALTADEWGTIQVFRARLK